MQYVCGKREMCTELWWSNLKEKQHFEDRNVGGKIIRYSSDGTEDVAWIDLTQNCDERRAVLNTVMKWGEFVDKLKNCYFLKNGSVPWSQLINPRFVTNY